MGKRRAAEKRAECVNPQQTTESAIARTPTLLRADLAQEARQRKPAVRPRQVHQTEQAKSVVGTVTFVTWGEALRSTAQELASEWDAPAESITNGAAPTPAFSLCLEGETGKDHLNLLPEEWRERRHAAAEHPAVTGRQIAKVPTQKLVKRFRRTQRQPAVQEGLDVGVVPFFG